MKLEVVVVDGKANVSIEELDYKALATNPDGAALLSEGIHMFQMLAQRFMAAQVPAAKADEAEEAPTDE